MFESLCFSNVLKLGKESVAGKGLAKYLNKQVLLTVHNGN